MRILTDKTMTSDTFKKIGSENFDDGSPAMTLHIENIREDKMKKLEKLTGEADVYYRVKINELVETVNQLIDKIEK